MFSYILRLKCDFFKKRYYKLLPSVISVNVMLQTSNFQQVLKTMLFRSCINIFKFLCRIPEFGAKTFLNFGVFWAKLENFLLHKEHLCYKPVSSCRLWTHSQESPRSLSRYAELIILFHTSWNTRSSISERVAKTLVKLCVVNFEFDLNTRLYFITSLKKFCRMLGDKKTK